MPSRGSENEDLDSGGGRERHSDDAVAGRKNHYRVREEVKGSPAPAVKNTTAIQGRNPNAMTTEVRRSGRWGTSMLESALNLTSGDVFFLRSSVPRWAGRIEFTELTDIEDAPEWPVII